MVGKGKTRRYKASSEATDTFTKNTGRMEINHDDKECYNFCDTVCHCCGASSVDVEGFLLQCNACKKAHYCSMKCFNEDLSKHMEICQTSALKKEGAKLNPSEPAKRGDANEDASFSKNKRADARGAIEGDNEVSSTSESEVIPEDWSVASLSVNDMPIPQEVDLNECLSDCSTDSDLDSSYTTDGSYSSSSSEEDNCLHHSFESSIGLDRVLEVSEKESEPDTSPTPTETPFCKEHAAGSSEASRPVDRTAARPVRYMSDNSSFSEVLGCNIHLPSGDDVTSNCGLKPNHESQKIDEEKRMRDRLTNLWTLPETPLVEADRNSVQFTGRPKNLHMTKSMMEEQGRMSNRLGNLWRLADAAKSSNSGETESKRKVSSTRSPKRGGNSEGSQTTEQVDLRQKKVSKSIMEANVPARSIQTTLNTTERGQGIERAPLRTTSKGARIQRGQSIRKKHGATVGETSSTCDNLRTLLTKQPSTDSSSSSLSSATTQRRRGRRRGEEATPQTPSRSISSGSSSISRNKRKPHHPKSGKRQRLPSRLHKDQSFRVAQKGSFRVTRGKLDVTLNVLKLEETVDATPIWTNNISSVLRTTSKGEKLRKDGSIRTILTEAIASMKDDAPTAASKTSNSENNDLHSSINQLEASIAQMGFVLEECPAS